MYFTLFILFVLLYVKYFKVDEKTGKDLIIWSFPVILAWFLTCALQYDVGGDYFSYLACATRDEIGLAKLRQFVVDGEYLFALLLAIVQIIGWPQLIFVLSSAIHIVLFVFALNHLKEKGYKVSSILFLFFTISVSFFQQFNGIRQYIAVYLIFFGFLLQIDNPKSKLSILLVACAPFFHRAAWAMFFVFVLMHFVQNRIRFSMKYFIYASLACCALFIIDFNDVIAFILEKTGIYAEYIGHEYVSKMSYLNIATRSVKLFPIYFCFWQMRSFRLERYETKLLILSAISCLVMLLSFSSTLLWRFYLFVDLFVYFPVMLFLKHSKNEKRKKIILCYLAAMLLPKVLLFPTGEYLYQSILFI